MREKQIITAVRHTEWKELEAVREKQITTVGRYRMKKRRKQETKTWQREIWILTGSLTEKIQDV